MSFSGKKIALDCGFRPADSVLVAYLPKLDAVVQELYDGERTLHAVDGVVLDMTAAKPVRWWQTRDAASKAKLAIVQTYYFGKARDFTPAKIYKWPNEGLGRLHMRAYSSGPWICIEPEQIAKVYADEQT